MESLPEITFKFYINCYIPSWPKPWPTWDKTRHLPRVRNFYLKKEEFPLLEIQSSETFAIESREILNYSADMIQLSEKIQLWKQFIRSENIVRVSKTLYSNATSKFELLNILKLFFPSSFIWASEKNDISEEMTPRCLVTKEFLAVLNSLERGHGCRPPPRPSSRGFTYCGAFAISKLASDESQVMSLLDPDLLWQRSDRLESHHLPWQRSDRHKSHHLPWQRSVKHICWAVINPLLLISFCFVSSETKRYCFQFRGELFT